MSVEKNVSDLMVSNVIANFITDDKNITLKVSIISHDIHIPNIFLIYCSQSFNKKVRFTTKFKCIVNLVQK